MQKHNNIEAGMQLAKSIVDTVNHATDKTIASDHQTTILVEDALKITKSFIDFINTKNRTN